MKVTRRMGHCIVACVVLWLLLQSLTAQAQSLQLALFKTATSSSEHAPLAAALDPVLQAEIGRVPKVSVAAVPPLDLPSLQLALDCVGETPSCLSVATERSKTDGLVSPSLQRSGATLVLSLLLYNPLQSSPLKVVTRSFANDASETVVLDGAKVLVQDLFGLAAPVAPEPQPVAEELEPPRPIPPPAESTPAPPEPQLTAAPRPGPERSQSLLVPIVLGAAGLGVIGVGIGFGVASNNTEARYGSTRIDGDADARKADELLSSARTQSTIANVAIGLGAASCVAAGVVYFLQRRTHKPDAEPHTRVALGFGYLGVTGGF